MKKVILVVGYVVFSVVMVSCAVAKPDAIATKFIEATSQRNFVEAKTYCNDAMAEVVDMTSTFAALAEDEPTKTVVTVVSTEIEEDIATVIYKTDTDEKEKTLHLKKEGKGWKVVLY